jgi:uncharacterized protein YraI
MNRRNLMKQMLGGSAALVIGGALATSGTLTAGASAGPEKLYTTSALNLRSQPSLSSSVLLVIPSGAAVGDQEEEQNGFSKISYSGSIGWAKSEYLTGGDGGSSDSGNPNNAAYRGQATTTSAVNLRSGAGTNYGIKMQLPTGAVVEVYDDYAYYFWLVKYNGQFGWVHADFLLMDYDMGSDIPAYTGIGLTTTTVNLRSGAGTNYSVLAVVPANAQIELYEGPAGSWGRVRYNGQFGYIHSDYIASTL